MDSYYSEKVRGGEGGGYIRLTSHNCSQGLIPHRITGYLIGSQYGAYNIL